MTGAEKMEMLAPARYAAALSIAAGGLMHAAGMGKTLLYGLSYPWWYWLTFLFVFLLYQAGAGLILMNRRPGYVIAFLGPVIGGLLVMPGLIFSGSRLLVLLPGTRVNEITWIGFITLIVEPVACAAGALLIKEKIWEAG